VNDHKPDGRQFFYNVEEAGISVHSKDFEDAYGDVNMAESVKDNTMQKLP
jgi:hypothetical protein